jgi:hypothetical protein
MTSLDDSDEATPSAGSYEVAVAMMPIGDRAPGSSNSTPETAITGPGFDQTAGRHATARSLLLAKGDAAVELATEAIARQIGLAARRIAESIERQASSSLSPSALDLASVEISFGVTLSAGIEAMFTAKSESSAEVTIILNRRSSQ